MIIIDPKLLQFILTSCQREIKVEDLILQNFLAMSNFTLKFRTNQRGSNWSCDHSVSLWLA